MTTTPHALFPQVAAMVLACWAAACILYLPPVANRLRVPAGRLVFILGWLVLAAYMAWMWIALERPPMRTQGETRLWYVLILPLFALLMEWRWKMHYLAIINILMAAGFIIKNLTSPELFDKSLMPALQSPWFVPHVIVYMVAYAAVGAAAAYALVVLAIDLAKPGALAAEAAPAMQRLVHIGFPLMTAGLVFGALWAKVAWGHYWSWDPKETWAFISWAMYLIYLHLTSSVRLSPRVHLAIIAGAFLLVLGCWFGVNALPTSPDSMHSYMN